jgi:hypothetical protein
MTYRVFFNSDFKMTAKGSFVVVFNITFCKRKIEVSLRTKSKAKVAKSAAALSDKPQRHWDSLRIT